MSLLGFLTRSQFIAVNLLNQSPTSPNEKILAPSCWTNIVGAPVQHHHLSYFFQNIQIHTEFINEHIISQRQFYCQTLKKIVDHSVYTAWRGFYMIILEVFKSYSYNTPCNIFSPVPGFCSIYYPPIKTRGQRNHTGSDRNH